MAAASKSRQACVQFGDPAAPEGVQVSTPQFLRDCHESALARFRGARGPPDECRTVRHQVPPKPGDDGSTGLIVAHVSRAFCAAWENGLPPGVRAKRAHLEAQLHLALEDLADQDMHGYLAMTREQCAIYGPDLVQLVNESLDRTTFSKVGLRADPRWEGTLVGRVQPPYLVLVVSIGLVTAAGMDAAPRTSGPSPRRRNQKRAKR